MKIACIAPAHPYRGGIAHFAVRLARHLSNSNEVLFINFSRLYPDFLVRGKTQYDESSSPLAYQSERLLDSVWPPSWPRVVKRIKSWGADAVVFHWWHPFFAPAYGIIARQIRRFAIPVAICHNVIPHESGPFFLSATRFGLSPMSGLVLHARAEELVAEKCLPGKSRVTLFHPVYDIFPGERIPREMARNLLGFGPDDRIVLYFGLIRPYKGVDVLLQAAKQLGDIPNLKLAIIGEIYFDRQRITSLAESAPAGMVQLVDRYIPNEDVAVWFRAADIVALPYLSATQSGVVPIAYRCQRPVIVTRVGGLPDVVEQGVSGYLVEPGNPTAIASAIREHFVGRDAPDMTAGIESVSGRMSWETYTESLVAFLHRLKDARNAA